MPKDTRQCASERACQRHAMANLSQRNQHSLELCSLLKGACLQAIHVVRGKPVSVEESLITEDTALS